MMKRYVVILILIGILNGIVVVNADDLEKLWEYRIVEDVYKVNIKDVNADGQMEILMAGKDRTQYGRDKIYLLNSRGDLMLKIEVENLRDFYLADAYGDSRDEIIVSYGRIVNNIPRGGLYIFDLEGNVLSEYPKGMLKSNIVLNNIVATDIDRDYRNEIVGNSKEGIYVFDDTYDGILWRWMSGRTIRNTVVEDIFEDTLPEIITIGVDEVNVFSHDGLKKWNYSMPEGVLSVGTVDYDILGYKEVVIASSNRSVHILDVNGGFRDKFVLDGDILNMVVEDTNNDLDDDLVFGTDNGIYIVDRQGNKTYSYRTDSRIERLIVSDIGNDEDRYVLFSIGTTIFAIDSNAILRHSYETDVNGEIKDFYIINLDSDRFMDFIVATENSIVAFKQKIRMVNEGETRNKAMVYYNRAYLQFNLGDIENASEYARTALDLYVRIDDEKGIERARALIQQIDAVRREENKTSTDIDNKSVIETTIKLPSTLSTIMVDKGTGSITIPILAIIVIAIIGIIFYAKHNKYKKSDTMSYKLINYSKILDNDTDEVIRRIDKMENPDIEKIIVLERKGRGRKELLEWLDNRGKMR